MTSLNCQDNLNPLYNNYYKLEILRGTKKLELMVQKANLPGLTIPDQAQPTIFGTTIPVPSMTVQYEPLSVEFIVDENLTNWKSIYSWMRNLTNIENANDYNLNYNQWHYDATLSIMSSEFKYAGCNDPVLTVGFTNLIPVRLTGLIFQSDSPDTNILKASCTFKYSFYTLLPDAPENLYGNPSN
jgi:hypothetical protein